MRISIILSGLHLVAATLWLSVAFGDSGQQKIDFGKDDGTRLSMAKAVLESIEIDATECSVAIKMGRGYAAQCRPFVKQIAEGGNYDQAKTVIEELYNKPELYNKYRFDFSNIEGIAKRIGDTASLFNVRNKILESRYR